MNGILLSGYTEYQLSDNIRGFSYLLVQTGYLIGLLFIFPIFTIRLSFHHVGEHSLKVNM